MNILIISTSDIGHGAAISAYNLHTGLRKAGFNSNLLVSEKLSKDQHVYLAKTPAQSKLGQIVQDIDYKIEYFLNHTGPQNIYSVVSKGIKKNPLVLNADIIHLHNIHWHSKNFTPLMLLSLSKTKPTIWTFHDMWPLTGHCIYSYDCDRWKKGCGYCPHLRIYIGLLFDTTALLFKIKKYIYLRSKFAVVTPSPWLTRLAAESPLLENHPIYNIPYGIDQEIFYPRKTSVARKAIGISDPDKKVILFVASHLDDQRKGYEYFEKAMLNLRHQYKYTAVILLTVGKGKVSEVLKSLFVVKEIGHVSERALMAQIYSAADIYVMPSILDNLPNVILESMACGTPVACFDTGGMPDIVHHRLNGYLANNKDVDDLTKGIYELLSNSDRLKEMRVNAVKTINDNFSESSQVERYINLYKELLSRL